MQTFRAKGDSYQELSEPSDNSRFMTKPQFTNRRTVLRTIGVGVVGSTLAAGITAAGDHTFASELNTSRATTRKYRDIATAEANGYSFFNIIPPVGVIYENLSDNVGNTSQTEDPSLLFYAPTPNADIESEEDVENSNTILAGVEYHVDGRGQGDQDMFADETASRKLKVSEKDGWHSSPKGAPPLTGLHVWVHLQNPNGVFAGPHATIKDRLTD